MTTKVEQNNKNVKSLRRLAELFKSETLLVPTGNLFGIKPDKYQAHKFLRYIADMLEK